MVLVNKQKNTNSNYFFFQKTTMDLWMHTFTCLGNLGIMPPLDLDMWPLFCPRRSPRVPIPTLKFTVPSKWASEKRRSIKLKLGTVGPGYFLDVQKGRVWKWMEKNGELGLGSCGLVIITRKNIYPICIGRWNNPLMSQKVSKWLGSIGYFTYL